MPSSCSGVAPATFASGTPSTRATSPRTAERTNDSRSAAGSAGHLLGRTRPRPPPTRRTPTRTRTSARNNGGISVRGGRLARERQRHGHRHRGAAAHDGLEQRCAFAVGELPHGLVGGHVHGHAALTPRAPRDRLAGEPGRAPLAHPAVEPPVGRGVRRLAGRSERARDRRERQEQVELRARGGRLEGLHARRPSGRTTRATCSGSCCARARRRARRPRGRRPGRSAIARRPQLRSAAASVTSTAGSSTSHAGGAPARPPAPGPRRRGPLRRAATTAPAPARRAPTSHCAVTSAERARAAADQHGAVRAHPARAGGERPACPRARRRPSSGTPTASRRGGATLVRPGFNAPLARPSRSSREQGPPIRSGPASTRSNARYRTPCDASIAAASRTSVLPISTNRPPGFTSDSEASTNSRASAFRTTVRPDVLPLLRERGVARVGHVRHAHRAHEVPLRRTRRAVHLGAEPSAPPAPPPCPRRRLRRAPAPCRRGPPRQVRQRVQRRQERQRKRRRHRVRQALGGSGPRSERRT
jgi:hypothetical protein